MGSTHADTNADQFSNYAAKASDDAKLRAVLSNLNSTEVRLCSLASKDFIDLVTGENGGAVLCSYVRLSVDFMELKSAWKLRHEKGSGLWYVLKVVYAVLNHPDGRYVRSDDRERLAVSRSIDKLASFVVGEKLQDVYGEIRSKEGKRQSAALLLLGAVVRRGSGLASEVAKVFDFKMPGFCKLAEVKKGKNVDKKVRSKSKTRKSYVWFAMSFLDVAKPALLRWVLQQRDVFYSILRGISDDDDDTIEYVLTTLRDRVLTPESLLPPSLRSVLFGSNTLEQLINISGRDGGGPTAGLCHEVLVMVCTDPCNGLMPDLGARPTPLKGNQKRLLDLMKKLKATEVDYHKALLLSIVKGRPSLGSAYLDEFPYNVEDHASSNWTASALLAADLVSSVSSSLSFSFLDLQSHQVITFDNPDVQSIMKCISPRSFSRSTINKGLLHSHFSVKHGTLRLLLEALKLLDCFLSAINVVSFSNQKNKNVLVSLRLDILNEARLLLPDPQVVLTLLSTLSSQSRDRGSCSKRIADIEILAKQNGRTIKKPKGEIIKEDMDILVAGIISNDDDAMTIEEDDGEGSDFADDPHIKECPKLSGQNWWLERCSSVLTASKDEDIYFQSKLLEAARFYLHIMPDTLESSFDFFVNILSSDSSLPTFFMQSLMSLLVQYAEDSRGSDSESKTLPLMYKHLQTFINLMIFSPVSDVREQAYVMAHSSMLSTGAFDNNLSEIQAWFLFMPGFYRGRSVADNKEIEALRDVTFVVSSFLCDAISTVGNNLFKYWDHLRDQIHRIKGVKDMSPTFSPLVPCIFQKCLRLLNSESGTFTYAGKSMIALYVSNTLKYILQSQVDAKLFATWINIVLSKGFEYSSHAKNESASFSEWRPVRDLWNFAKSISMLEPHKLFDTDMNAVPTDPLFVSTLNEVKKVIGVGEIRELGSLTEGLCASTICTSSDDILMNFPTTMEVLGALLGVPLSFLSSIFFLDRSLLVRVLKSWSEIFAPALQSVTSDLRETESKNGIYEVSAHPPLADRTTYNPPTDSMNLTAAFGLFLDMVPFHIVFPLFMSIDGLQLMDQFKLKDWFLFKVSKCPFDLLIPTLRVVLFWFYQVQSYFRTNPSDELVRLSEICVVVIENLLDQMWVVQGEYENSASLQVLFSKRFLSEIAESILCHPSVINALELMLGETEKLTKKECGDIWTDFLFSGKDFSDADTWILADEVDHLSLRILRKASKKLLSFYDDSLCAHEDDTNLRNLIKKYDVIQDRLLKGLKKRIEVCIQSSDLAQVVPVIHVFRALKQLISPSELLVLAHWLLNRVSKKDLSNLRSRRLDVRIVCFHIARDIFETLARYWDQPKSEGMAYRQVHSMDKVFNVQLFEEIYFRVLDMAPWVKLEIADICLLKAIKVIYMLHAKPSQKIFPLSLALSRAVASTPVELVSHCIQKVTVTKAKLLFFLTELSPLHLSVFGNIFLEIANKLVSLNENVVEGDPCAFSNEQFLMLLPVALSYVNWSLMKFGKEHIAHLTSILSLYSGVLLKGFANWNSYVSGCLFQEDYSELLSFSSQELLHLCFNSLLGKAVIMLKYSCTLADSSITMKKRLKLFDSICNHSSGQDELLGCDISELESYSSSQLTNFLNTVTSKTLLCKLMLFPECFHGQSSQREEEGKRKDNTKYKSSRLRFVNMLMNTWCLIVSVSASNFALSGESNSGTNLLFKQLEVFILRTFVELVEKTRHSIIQLHSIPFLEQFFRTSLLHRFEDTTTLKMLRTVLTPLSEGTYSSDLFLQLLLSHSHFVSAMQMSFSTENEHAGVVAGQMSSILRVLVFTNDVNEKTEAVMSDLVSRKLELIKLLRLLFHLSFRKRGLDSEKHLDINLRELFLLLLSSYGATLSEVDLEIYSLMNDIECVDGLDSGNMSEMDYMWGRAALTIRQNQKHEVLAPHSANDVEDKEWRRTQFRENALFDPKLCLVTVLNFPHNRTTSTAELHASEFNVDKLEEENKVHILNTVDKKGYDPVFILRFSIHILSVGYVEPLEFAGLGLLPMAFVSISSPDEGIRKLGYETLGRFQSALEKLQKRKDVMRLRLLLTCVQNGIEEPLQQIPSVIAIFAAEASMILLEATNNHYSDIVEFLTSFFALKMKRVPLFNKFFWSSSLNFKNERVWILRLCYTGLRLKEDAQIYIRSSVLENILSFYSSPLADDDSKLLILQILYKAVKQHRTTRHLVENCSLLPWLSQRVSYFSEELDGERKASFTAHLFLVCQIVKEIVSSRNFAEWLQNQSLEQLSEFSSQLFRLLINGEALFGEHVGLANSILQIVTSTAKISQKRNIYQAHFTLSFDGLFQMYKTVGLSGCNSTAEFALKAVLMSTPPVAVTRMNQEKLSEFVMWAISTAASSDSMQVTPHSTCGPHLAVKSEEPPHEDSLTWKLLRWLTASVILAKVSAPAKKGIHGNLDTLDHGSLGSLFESIRHLQDSSKSSSCSEETLAASIFYLHQLLGHNCRVTLSVIAALCILLFPSKITAAGSESISPVDYGIHVAPLVSKIRSPPEANPKWRWTYYQPWEDRTSSRSDSEKLEESEACERLIGTILNVLQQRRLYSQNLSS